MSEEEYLVLTLALECEVMLVVDWLALLRPQLLFYQLLAHQLFISLKLGFLFPSSSVYSMLQVLVLD
jgi:hypothetical protein